MGQTPSTRQPDISDGSIYIGKNGIKMPGLQVSKDGVRIGEDLFPPKKVDIEDRWFYIGDEGIKIPGLSVSEKGVKIGGIFGFESLQVDNSSIKQLSKVNQLPLMQMAMAFMSMGN